MARAARQFIVKVHGRCDLACDYCYVFTSPDQRWRGRTRTMSAAVAEQAVTRIAEHTAAHGLPEVELVLHGGEPLLAGRAFLGGLARDARARVPAEVRITVQTNGLSLDRAFVDLFHDHGIRVGISMDGGPAAHDRHRRTHAGKGSHDRVRAAVELMSEPGNRDLFAGLLCVVDVRNDPVEVYAALTEFAPPSIDFLLPHATWAAPPPRRTPTPYADWLIAAFDHWRRQGSATRVRLFDAVIALWLGGGSSVEGWGTEPTPQVVIETDGSLERSDILAVAYAGAGATGLHVRDDPLGAAIDDPPPLPTPCLPCPVLAVCGGGHPAHRYAEGSGFDNPSVFCPDLFRFATHVRSSLATELGVLTADR